jgi:hypothetical protein
MWDESSIFGIFLRILANAYWNWMETKLISLILRYSYLPLKDLSNQSTYSL